MSCRRICIAACDHLLLVTMVAPLVSMYWCGMFFLVDLYVIPSDYVKSIWFTCVVGEFPSPNVDIRLSAIEVFCARGSG